MALGVLVLVAFAPACESGTSSGSVFDDAGDRDDAATCPERLREIMARVSDLAREAGSGERVALLKTKAGAFGAAP